MDQAGFPTALVFDLKKESPFSFKCQVCSACCFNKAIRVAPYEALRLARNLGITTTDFHRTCTEEGGIVLRNKPDGSCIFLDSRGCGVHPDRPLVCRLYPLGQITDKEGREKYASMPLHPDCLGHFGADGTVESYLDSQGVELYFHFDAVYAAVYEKMLKKLGGKGFTAADILSLGETQPFDPGSSSHHGLLSTWLDIDRTVAAFRRESRRKEPKSLDEVVSLHLEAIEAWLAAL
ncbi:MAG: YkgJ family cysteine cluster protein [Candidatus Aminicenantales bacterium]